LAKKLEDKYHIIVVGTINQNRKGIPGFLKTVKGRAEGDYIVLFEVGGNCSLHSWVTNTASGKIKEKEMNKLRANI
jgi:hypothetical protein